MPHPKPGQKISADQIDESDISAWISPDGKIYFANYYGHWQAAEILGDPTGGRDLEDGGWCHLTDGFIRGDYTKFTQSTIDALFDVLMSLRSRGAEGYRVNTFYQRCEELLKYF